MDRINGSSLNHTTKGYLGFDNGNMKEMKERAQIWVTGIVQGVGFRPFIHNLALRLALNGWVRNTSAGVEIEVEGERSSLDTFITALNTEAPALAHIDTVDINFTSPNGFLKFEIIDSEVIRDAFQPLSPDICVCDDCLRELFDPLDRRYLYPFINCTNCGPRFTIIQDIPYDRPLTTMAQFPMCPECAKEYRDPTNRRFHAQPVACPRCGPVVWLEEHNQSDIKINGSRSLVHRSNEDAIRVSQSLLAQGKIIAVKGLGGFHLACDATNIESVRDLRRRKLRVDKPFALMMADMETIRQHCWVNSYEARLLESKERPIVILHRKSDSSIAPEAAPNQSSLGVMLPYTPLHYLLLSKLANNPDLTERNMASAYIPQALIMTSGNIREEPIAIGNDEARIRLAALCDAYLMHNRDIHTRCDDSVVRVFQSRIKQINNKKQDDKVFPIRRSRGYAPFPIKLNLNAPSILAVGGELKNTFCLTKNNYAIMSHHIGDMENYETLQSFEDGIDHFERLFRIAPVLISHDLHPNYLSTNYAVKRSQSYGIPAYGVQHHHAHIAACMVENKIVAGNEVFGVAFDGTGLGDDGAIWGGEFFMAGYKSYQRVAHLEYMPLPGGDAAIRNPARIALSYLWQLGIDWGLSPRALESLSKEERSILRSQLEQEINTPLTSSMGRLFDAISAMIGIRNKVNYEAQAAIELENVVDPLETKYYPFEINFSNTQVPYSIRLDPLIESIAKDFQQEVSVPRISARFHNSVAYLVLDVLVAMRKFLGERPVVLSGGVWQNMTLLNKTSELLSDNGFQVFTHHLVPVNDGGIALGQAMVALHNTYL